MLNFGFYTFFVMLDMQDYISALSTAIDSQTSCSVLKLPRELVE